VPTRSLQLSPIASLSRLPASSYTLEAWLEVDPDGEPLSRSRPLALRSLWPAPASPSVFRLPGCRLQSLPSRLGLRLRRPPRRWLRRHRPRARRRPGRAVATSRQTCQSAHLVALSLVLSGVAAASPRPPQRHRPRSRCTCHRRRAPPLRPPSFPACSNVPIPVDAARQRRRAIRPRTGASLWRPPTWTGETKSTGVGSDTTRPVEGPTTDQEIHGSVITGATLTSIRCTQDIGSRERLRF
jgi:hypothetical protein